MNKIRLLTTVITTALLTPLTAMATPNALFGKGLQQAPKCHYQSIKSPQYHIDPHETTMLKAAFYYDASTIKSRQGFDKFYIQLKSQPFKVFTQGIQTAEDRSHIHGHGRYQHLTLDGIAYLRDKAYSTQVITQDCTLYYLSGDVPLRFVHEMVKTADDQTLSKNAIITQLYGKNVLKPLTLTAQINEDKAHQLWILETPYNNHQQLMARVKQPTHRVDAVVLMADLHFLDSFGKVTEAIDQNQQVHPLQHTNLQARCFIEGCQLTESVAIQLSEDFLKHHRHGFSLRLRGEKEKTVTVSKNMVEGLLEGLQKLSHAATASQSI